MKKTKILFLDTNDEIGGVFTVLASLLEGLDRKRFAITVACEKQGKPEKEFAKIDGIRVVGCRFGAKPEGVAGTGFGSKIFDLLRLPLLAWAVLRLCALVVFSGIDIIYTSDKIRTMLVAALVKSLTGRKLVYHIHGMCVPSRLNSMALKKSETILANSAATKKDFIRLLGPDMERLMRVLIEDRNRIVMADLKEVLTRPDTPSSIALFYGAGHMDNMERALVGELGYKPAGEVWLPAFGVDYADAGLTEPDLAMIRALSQLQRQLLQPRNTRPPPAKQEEVQLFDPLWED